MKRNPNDLLRPSKIESLTIYTRSQRVWKHLYRRSRNSTKLPHCCLELDSILNSTPSIPDNAVSETVTQNILYLEGFSRWKITSEKNCERDKETKCSKSQKVIIGVLNPTICRVSDEFFPRWNGFEGVETTFNSQQCNYLCPLILGWSYILSVRLVELRKCTSEDGISYTDNHAPWEDLERVQSTPNIHTLALGSVHEHELRWWSAILAKGRGWNAHVLRSDKVFSPPWACHLNDDITFKLTYTSKDESSSHISKDPPSSSEALEYLHRFASLHGVLDKLSAALAAALTLPAHVRFGAPVILPTPIIKPPPQFIQHNDAIDPDTFANLSKYLSNFMTISCVPNVLHSSLFSSCWEPGITCNLASEWLQPFFKVLALLLEQNSRCSLIQLLAAHQPTVAPLWLGVAISGLLPRIITIWKSYLPNTSPEASVWTKSSQSFMDCKYFRTPQLSNDSTARSILREDEFRLLYLMDVDSTTYGPPPMSPYPPFGFSKLKDVALEVQLHANCGHMLQYLDWVWKDTDGQNQINDSGVLPISQRITKDEVHVKDNRRCSPRTFTLGTFIVWPMNLLKLNQSLTEELSEKATRNCFSWIYFADGIRVDEQQMWDHDWLNILRDKENEGNENPLSHSSNLSINPADGDS